MIRTATIVAVLAGFFATASADKICHDMQVCEEVCTEIFFEPIEVELELTLLTSGSIDPFFGLPLHCETACTFEKVCFPEGTTGGDYGTDDIDRCYREPLLVDQIRCIQMLGS